MRDLAVLGATGSIGRNTLAVVRAQPGRWRVVALAAGRNAERLAEQAREFAPRLLAVADAATAAELADRLRGADLPRAPQIVSGPAGLVAAAEAADLVLNAVVGAAGLRPTLAAVRRGARLALANKESLVLGGELVTATARAAGATILPVDSEHAGLFQCLAGGDVADVERLVLTASGGPLRAHPDWRRATPAEVLAHPVWSMGARITTDSATLLNKGLEVIEARWLFGVGLDRIGVLVHPQAAVHALVEWRDGSVTAQLAVPDMRLPIQMALAWPQRLTAAIARLDLAAIGALEFAEVVPERYPCFALARAAAAAGGLAPTVLNAADEVAVELFHAGRIALGRLPDLLAACLDAHPGGPADSLEAIEAADEWARAEARRRAAA